MASHKTCPHAGEERVHFSGTQIREMLRRGESLPREFTRPEIGRILVEWTRSTMAASVPEGPARAGGATS
jgi:sulfate adenylyltransferase